MNEQAADRREELAGALAAVRERVARAMSAAGRTDEVTLIAVTKFFPAADIDLLAELGLRDIGENKVQEAAVKVAEVHLRDRLRVHFIGQLQSNKARSVSEWADAVHGIDREKVARALSRGALEHGRILDVLIQVSLDEIPVAGRGGIRPEEVSDLADVVGQAEGLRLRGVMAVAPLGADPRAAFERLRTISGQVREQHPAAVWISAGMSEDLEAAVSAGATHLRVGSAILGSRPSLR